MKLYSHIILSYNKSGDSMKKVTIFALHLGYGGIERCISMLANALCDEYQVEIISTYELGEHPAFFLNKQIQVQYLLKETSPNRQEFLRALKSFHFIQAWKEGMRAIHILKWKKEKMIGAMQECNSDIMIATRDIHNKWLGKYGKKSAYKIGWEHNHPHGNQRYMKKVIESVKNLDAFVLVSPELKKLYESKVTCPCIYIPNAIEDFQNELSKQTEKKIISIGRLSKEKGYSDLIDVFDMVHKLFPDWHLDIIGDGIERDSLVHKINHYQLQKDITLHGYQGKEYINNLLEHSSIYVMSSFTESFGIVLLEAFSFGLPCVAFDSAEGANLLISNNWDGYLIKNRDKEQMAKRICELIQNQNRRIVMGDNGMKKATTYQMSEVKKQWLALLEKETI